MPHRHRRKHNHDHYKHNPKAELEFYDECNAYVSTTRAVAEGESRSFILVEVTTTSKHIQCVVHCIDPGVKEGYIAEQKLNMCQLAIVHSKEVIGDAMSRILTNVTHAQQLSQLMGEPIQDILNTLLKSKSARDEAEDLLNGILSEAHKRVSDG